MRNTQFFQEKNPLYRARLFLRVWFEVQEQETHHAKDTWLAVGRSCIRAACGKLSVNVRPVEREA